MAKIIFLKGLPASGKSTWAKSQLEGGKCLRVCKDDIRENMLGPWSRRKEKDVLKIRDDLIRLGVSLNRTVIVDDTNLHPKHERAVRALAEELGVEFEIKDDFLEVSPLECIARDLKRLNSVGANVIWQMYDQFVKPDSMKKLDLEWGKRRCVIFDVDGTLAHNRSGRNMYDFTKVWTDTPDPFMSMVADAIADNEDFYADVVIVSGREDSCRELTEKWLKAQCIPYKHLYMRQTGDKRDDAIVKEEIYHKFIEPDYCVVGVFDDRPKVCRMWRKLGLNVAQLANPYIEF